MNSKKHSESETAGAVAGIIAEIASKGTPGVGPAVALTISAVLKSVQIARIKRMSETIEIAMDLMDVGLEIFEERAAEYDSRLELLAQVLETATHTTMPEKIRALSKILAHGFLDDQDGIARARILAAALGDIEGPHIRVLALLKSEPHPRPGTTHEAIATIQDGDPEPPPPAGWNVDELGERLAQDAVIMPAILAVLSGHGLATTGVPGPAEMWEIVATYRVTPLGSLCLDLLEL